MPDNSSPFFRKAITPWYQSKLAYMIIIVVMLGFFFFGIAGLGVTREVAAYRSYAWVPILLMVLSGALVVTTMIRLIQSYTAK